jgi:hypothetical protein
MLIEPINYRMVNSKASQKLEVGSAQEFVETRILGGFLENDEFGLGDRHALRLEQ